MEGSGNRLSTAPPQSPASPSRPQSNFLPDADRSEPKRRRHVIDAESLPHDSIATQIVSDIRAHDSTRMHIGNSNTYNLGPITQNLDPTAMHGSRTVPTSSLTDKMDTLKYERMNARYLGLRPGLDKSCEWVYDRSEYVNWQNPNMIAKHHGRLWIKGKPGSGKSTLMKMTVDKDTSKRGSDAIISHFFYRGGGILETSAGKMYQSLLFQLLEQLPRLRPVLDTWTTTGLQQEEWPAEVLANVFRTAVLQVGDKDVVSCYVDALDECDEREAWSIIEFFEDLTDATIRCGVRFLFCISSRHYPHITMSKCLELVLDHQDGHSHDISSYVNSRLKLTNPGQKRELVKRICEKASGVFLWVRFVVDELNKEHDNGNSHMLQDCLNSMPSELSALFARIVRKDARHDPAFVPTLQWALFSRVPLTREEFYTAVRTRLGGTETKYDASKTDMERFILRSSKGFVELVKGKQRTFQFIHETVRDYFASAGLAILDPAFDENMEGQSQNQLMRCCQDYLRYVIVNDFSLSRGIPERRPQAKRFRDVLLKRHPFLKYALGGVLYHADLAHSCKLPQHEFLETFEFKTWTLLKDALEIFLRRRYDGRLGRRWILAEQGASFLLERDLQLDPGREFEARRYQSMLGVAVEHKHARSVEILLEYGADANSVGRDDMSCLHLAVKQGVARIVKALLAAGASITPVILRLAVEQGNLEICQEVLGKGPMEDPRGQTCGDLLRSASSHNHLAIVTWLLGRGAAVNATTELGTPLEAASINGHVAMSKLLIEHGADVNRNGNALCKASRGGHTVLVQIFLAHVASQGAACKGMDTALQVACRRGHKEIAEILLKNGADVNSATGGNGSALQAASASGNAPLVQRLIAHGANVDATDHESRTSLYAACEAGHEGVVGALLTSGANVNHCGDQHGSALQTAVLSENHSGICQMLIDAGADVNLQGGRYGNALQTACAMRCHHNGFKGAVCVAPGLGLCRATIVQLLLKNGAEINAQGGHFGNALQAACARSCRRVVRLLLDKGADPIAEGGFYGSIQKAVESHDRFDIAEMVGVARTKRLEILIRYRLAALANPSAPRVLLQESEANRKRKREAETQPKEAQAPENIVNLTDVQEVLCYAPSDKLPSSKASAAPARSVQTPTEVPVLPSISSSAPVDRKKDQGVENTLNKGPNLGLEAAVRDVAAKIVARRPASTQGKVLERTMGNLFGSTNPSPHWNDSMLNGPNLGLEAAVRDVAAKIVARRPASTQGKVLERTMGNLFGSTSPSPHWNDSMLKGQKRPDRQQTGV